MESIWMRRANSQYVCMPSMYVWMPSMHACLLSVYVCLGKIVLQRTRSDSLRNTCSIWRLIQFFEICEGGYFCGAHTYILTHVSVCPLPLNLRWGQFTSSSEYWSDRRHRLLAASSDTSKRLCLSGFCDLERFVWMSDTKSHVPVKVFSTFSRIR